MKRRSIVKKPVFCEFCYRYNCKKHTKGKNYDKTSLHNKRELDDQDGRDEFGPASKGSSD